jgi:pyrimidine-nucleoside phosphorylase
MRESPGRLIRRKRDGEELTEAEIRDLVGGVVDGTLQDAQLGAFLMAVCLRGMTVAETRALTLAMRDSAPVLDLTSVPGVKVDKHSTGGVGDKVSLALAPLVASCGVPVPMVSGRGLGHTGGTIDKLSAIPGYRTALTRDEFVLVLRDCGFAMAAAGEWLAPADARMYRTRDVTGTVESIPLITASILAKKLAEGIDALVMDVKVGRAAFLTARDDAEALRESLVATGRAAGIEVVAVLSSMDVPLGCAVGNAVEVVEAIECLRGRGPADLRALTVALGAEMLVLGGVARDAGDAAIRLEKALDTGAALAWLQRNVERQGGDPRIVDDPSRLPNAPCVVPVVTDVDGVVTDIEPLAIGRAAADLGAGRRRSDDEIDPAVGIVLAAQVGATVAAGQPIAWIHARTPSAAHAVQDGVVLAFRIGQ